MIVHEFSTQSNSRPTIQSSKQNKECASADNFGILASWFNIVQKWKEDCNTQVEDMRNIDEKGFMQGVVAKLKCMFSNHELPASMTQPGNCEWTSLLQCVSDDSKSINNHTIFPRPNNCRHLGMILEFFKVATYS